MIQNIRVNRKRLYKTAFLSTYRILMYVELFRFEYPRKAVHRFLRASIYNHTCPPHLCSILYVPTRLIKLTLLTGNNFFRKEWYHIDTVTLKSFSSAALTETMLSSTNDK